MKRFHVLAVLGLFALGRPVLAQATVSGAVYEDRNANGRRDTGERGLARVAVSNQVDVVVTDAIGAFTLPGTGTGVVFVSVPDGFRSSGTFWQPAATPAIAFGLAPTPAGEFAFVHASDTHIQPSAVARFDRLRAIVDSVSPRFVLITGDLVRDALRVGEAEATGYYELFGREAAKIPVPVWTVPGNHELFGIERSRSGVSADHPLYNRGMFRHYRGPDYYSFTAGGVHFVGLNTADMSDQWYYGHVDSTQLKWLERDLAVVPPNVPVVTFNHIPFVSAKMALDGYTDEPPAPTTIRIAGKDQYRHVASNLDELLAVIGARPFPLALGGHLHTRERIEFGTDGRAPTRFEQTAAVVGPAGPDWLAMASGVTVYRVRDGRVSAGEFVRLDPARR
jgi:3',5'-cyclic AMP phosphodiesterase CpdA